MHVHPFVGLCRTGAALLSDMQARLGRQSDTNTLNWKASFQLVPWFNWSPKLGKYEYKGPSATIVRVDYIKRCQMQTNR